MKISKLQTGLCFACLVIFITAPAFSVQKYQDKLEKAESRLRGIFEKKEYNPKSFRGQWLDDSSGYTVTEDTDDSGKKVRVLYDVRGKRTIPGDNEKRNKNKSEKISPNGKYEIYTEKGNLHVRDLDSKKSVQLTRSKEDSGISYGQASWSPDGKLIVFVRSDYSQVRQRNVLVPGDPSYPGVKKIRFARIGETIPSLRIGVVDAEGKQIRWLAIPEPAEGFYLGQVSWACNSHEVLVEKLSRFRDRRNFLLADINTGTVKCIFGEHDPTWVVASYRKNSGLDWIRGGKEFIVVSEKDGWRHAYIYSRQGKELSLLTPGKFDIIQKSIVDEKGGYYYFYASPDNGTQRYLYRVKLKGKAKPQLVTPQDQPGTHSYDFSPDAKWAFHT